MPLRIKNDSNNIVEILTEVYGSKHYTHLSNNYVILPQEEKEVELYLLNPLKLRIKENDGT